MKVTTVGIDLAKNVFRVHGCDARGRTVFSSLPHAALGSERGEAAQVTPGLSNRIAICCRDCIPRSRSPPAAV